MKDIELLNELDVKIREMATALDRERRKNQVSNTELVESEKLSKIEDKLKSIISIIDESGVVKMDDRGNQVQISIFGQEYSVKAPADPEYIQKIAEYVDSKMRGKFNLGFRRHSLLLG